MNAEKNDGSVGGMHVPWPALVVVGFGLLLFVGGAAGRDAEELAGALQNVGVLATLFGLGGLIAQTLQSRPDWRAQGTRWLLVMLGGMALIQPHWGVALALALAVFGLSWGGSEERRY